VASTRFVVVSSIAVIGVAAALCGGCADQNKNSAYPPPNTPPAQSSPYQSSSYQSSATGTPSGSATASPQQTRMTTPPPVQIPAGARMVSEGPFPPPSFDVSESGTLYIWDENDNKIALITSAATSGGGTRNVNIAEMPNVTNALNNKHTYRVYYVPASAATTLPSPLGQ